MTVKDYQILNREAWQKFAEEYKEPAEKAPFLILKSRFDIMDT